MRISRASALAARLAARRASAYGRDRERERSKERKKKWVKSYWWWEITLPSEDLDAKKALQKANCRKNKFKSNKWRKITTGRRDFIWTPESPCLGNLSSSGGTRGLAEGLYMWMSRQSSQVKLTPPWFHHGTHCSTQLVNELLAVSVKWSVKRPFTEEYQYNDSVSAMHWYLGCCKCLFLYYFINQ